MIDSHALGSLMTKVIQNRESESAMTLPLVNLEDFERDRREFLLIYTITKAAVTHITRTMAILEQNSEKDQGHSRLCKSNSQLERWHHK